MERMRWLPELSDRPNVFVNVPLFRLWATDPVTGEEPLRMNVVVGKSLNHKTPIFVEQMEYVIFRPYWNPPLRHHGEGDHPARHGATPPTSTARSWRSSRAATTTRRRCRRRRRTSRRSSSGKLYLRQRPGPSNSLGLAKFIFPNAEDVYMHGTPAQQLFSRVRRDFSHGCIRLEDPARFAEWVLRDNPEWPRAKIDAAMQGETADARQPQAAAHGRDLLRHGARQLGGRGVLRGGHLRPRSRARRGARARLPVSDEDLDVDESETQRSRHHSMVQLFASLTTAIFVVTTSLAAQPARGFLRKPDAAAIRVLSWNVYRDSIFPPDGETVDVSAANRPAQFARVLQALRPDVLCLQQVTMSTARTAALVDSILPLGGGKTWQAHSAVDTVIVSRFNLRARAGGQVNYDERNRGHAIALLETPAANLFVICAHFQSSDGREDVILRRQQAEMIASTIREAKAGGGATPLQARTPFIVLGDFNAIAGATLFVDIIALGKPIHLAPGERAEGLDWDRSRLTDALPHHNGKGPERYTWRDDLDRFPPGVLDRILYSDSVLASVNQFVLDTTAMSYGELVGAGLRSIDVMRDPQAGIHDHFPVVIDVVLRPGRRR